MGDVADEIREWASTLPYWERVALHKVASGATITDADVQSLLDCLLWEYSLGGLTDPPPEPDFAGLATSSTGAKAKLVSISGLQGVNALVPDQTITFAPSLTAVYGENGSGKSGYARVLGCAGFTRGDIHILPDYNLPPDECPAASANLEVDDGTCTRTICFRAGVATPELHCFHVFDSTSVIAHVARSHGFSFTPAALAWFPRLAELTDEVRAVLEQRIEEHRAPRDFAKRFAGESAVVELVKKISVETDIKQLEDLAASTPDDIKARRKLEQRKAELLLRNTPKKTVELQTQIRDITTLKANIEKAEAMLGNAAMSSVAESLSEYTRLKSLSATEEVDQFVEDGLTKVGSEEWQAFALRAKALAEAESEGRDGYPQAGDICLLCHQPLTPEARSLLDRLWAYLKGEARTALADLNEGLDKQITALMSLDLGFFGEQAVTRRHLEARDKKLSLLIRRFVASLVQRREQVVASLQSRTSRELDSLGTSPQSHLDNMVAVLRAELTALKNQDSAEELQKVNAELRLMEHRDTLSRNLCDIKSYLRDLRWARKAERCKGSTRHITVKHNELFQELVTNEYIEAFKDRLQELDCPLSVRVATKPAKGLVTKQIELVPAHADSAGAPSPDRVLSEGEKRAVAMADFLTEVQLDEHCSGIVIDDPVTSLDHHWKDVIASSLVSEAEKRQVIIFTHDLHFLWMLSEAASNLRDMRIHWIKRGDVDDQPGYVYLDNCPGLERDYKTPRIASDYLQKAMDAGPAEQEHLLRQGFGALRTTYEAFVIHELLHSVVGRWQERIGLEGKLDKIVLDDEIVQTVVRKHGKISRFIEGHSHTDTTPKPSVKALSDEIREFTQLKKHQKELLRNAGKS